MGMLGAGKRYTVATISKTVGVFYLKNARSLKRTNIVHIFSSNRCANSRALFMSLKI
jgi:hypothetical protein